MTIHYLSYGWLLVLLVDVLIGWIAAGITANILIKRMARNGGQHVIIPVLHSLTGELSLSDELAKKFADPQKLSGVKPLIEDHINTFLTIKLQEKLPVIAMFASPDMLSKIKEGMLEEIDLLLPQVLKQYLQNTGSPQDIESLLQDSLQKISPDKMEQTLKSSLRKQLIFFRLAGAALGLLIGLLHLLAAMFYIA